MDLELETYTNTVLYKHGNSGIIRLLIQRVFEGGTSQSRLLTGCLLEHPLKFSSSLRVGIGSLAVTQTDHLTTVHKGPPRPTRSGTTYGTKIERKDLGPGRLVPSRSGGGLRTDV